MSDLLAIVTTSEKRKKLLILLDSGPQRWDEIKIQLNVTASGMLPQIKILEEKGLIIKEDKEYSLTDLGRLVVYYLEPFDKTLTVIEQQKKFWQDHDIEAFPRDFFFRIGDLKNPQIIEASTEESFEPHNQFLEMILRSKQVSGISPIVHPVYPKFFLSLAQDGREVQLILTKNAYGKIKKEYHHMLLEGLQFENARLSICEEDVRFAYIVTDIYFSMGLFLKNGIFDSKRDIVSNDPSAIMFGKDLFSYYLKKSHPVNKEGVYSGQPA
ncbi:MAG: winged helix-turn-helix domain-containing protein [Methanoregula sp.]|jgi:predicted transcriptional regulator|nr:winged helix-turn-helix domain-containing protein [Methanoregula sp.]